MKQPRIITAALSALFSLALLQVSAQVTNPLPGRTLNKLLPDYLRPRVYALNQANGSVP